MIDSAAIHIFATKLANLTQNADADDLTNMMIAVNEVLAQRAYAVMQAMGESHPMFDIAVQVNKDATRAMNEAICTQRFADDLR